MPRLARSTEPELMDAQDLSDAQTRPHLTQNLRDIARYNQLLGANVLMTNLVRELGAGNLGLDIGIGAGDFIVHAAQKLSFRWIGLDLSPTILNIALNNHGGRIHHAVAANATQLPFANNSVDVVTCALTIHHLQPPQVRHLFAECARVCRLGFAAIDFQRSYFGVLGAWLLTRLTSRNAFTRNDGVQSIRRAYTQTEVRRLLHDACCASASVRGVDPIRYAVLWRKQI